ncbi:hypothetical protein PG988_011724 [Apiospora saccharicola]
MFEASLPGRDMEPVIPLTGLPQLTRLETLYIDMSTLFGQSSGHGNKAGLPVVAGRFPSTTAAPLMRARQRWKRTSPSRESKMSWGRSRRRSSGGLL